MASKSSCISNVLRTVSRTYVAQAAASPTQAAGHFVKEGVKVTKLPNGLVVASQETYSPLSRVGVFLKAGTLYEKSTNLGITHMLRAITGLSTKDSSAFNVTRNLQQLGATLSCCNAKEYMQYSLEVPRDSLEPALSFLSAVLQPSFKSWEIRDNIYRINVDLATLDPQMELLDQLHKAAYRTGLGNSVYCPQHMIGKHTPEMLQEFTSQHFVSNHAAVAGVGVNHDSLVEYARSLPLATGQIPTVTSKYHGGEVRKETGSNVAYAAVAVESGGYSVVEDIMPVGVFLGALGCLPPGVKYGDGAGTLHKAVAGVSNGHYGISTFGYVYASTGLVGVTVVTPPEDMGKVLSASVKQLRSASVTDADVQRGKAQMKSLVLMYNESSSFCLENIGTQAMAFGQVFNNEEQLLPMIDSVTTAQVQAVAKKLSQGKLSMAAIGNLSTTPYIDEL